MRVALCGIQVLVAEQLLDLAQVCACAQKLGGEDMTKRVGSDALTLGDARGVGVAAKRGGEDRGGEAVAENAKEQGRVIGRRPRGPVVEKQRDKAGMNRQHPLSPALSDPHANQAALEVDVVPVETQQLRAAQTAVGEERQQEPVALGLAGMYSTPNVSATRRVEEAREL